MDKDIPMLYCKHICINFSNMKVYVTGNRGYEGFIHNPSPSVNDIREALFEACCRPDGGDAYNKWSIEVNGAGLRYFGFIPILHDCSSPEEAEIFINRKVREIVEKNQWDVVNRHTRSTTGHRFY
jgi:hypothetical protein